MSTLAIFWGSETNAILICRYSNCFMVLLNQRYHHNNTDRMGAMTAPGTVPTRDIEFNPNPITDTQDSSASRGYSTIDYGHQHRISKPSNFEPRRDDGAGGMMTSESTMSLPEMTFSKPEMR